MAKSMFDIIKRQNGETFAKTIRTLDPRILEIENLPQIVKYAGRDATPIIPFLRGLIPESESVILPYEDPIKLLKKAGYDAFYADTLKKQNSISKYFEDSERLCTFRDKQRYQNYFIINAVKENVSEIKRKDFIRPTRQDPYGTSVISIQIYKSGGFISIKNRYNHAVENPDNTFNSNPDNIIAGLTNSLKTYFNVDFSTAKAELPNNYTYQNDCIYRYNMEINNTYFGDYFYLKDGKITKINKDYQILIDSYLFDLKEKKVINLLRADDPYAQILNEEIKDHALQTKLIDGKINLLLDGKPFIVVDANHHLEEITLFKTTELPNSAFLNILSYASVVRAPKLKKIGYACFSNAGLKSVEAPCLEEMGDNCFSFLFNMKEIYLPSLKKAGNSCFNYLNATKRISLPQLESLADNSFQNSLLLRYIRLESVKRIGNNSLIENENLQRISLPRVLTIGNRSLNGNPNLKRLHLLNLQEIGENSISSNANLSKVFVPRLVRGGQKSFSNNKFGCYISAKNLELLEQGSLRNGARLYAPNIMNVDFVEHPFHRRMVQAHLCYKKSQKMLNLLGLLYQRNCQEKAG